MRTVTQFRIWHLLMAMLIIGLAFWLLRLGEDFDPELAENAQVVVSVNLLRSHGGDKYHWQTVQVGRVFKNETKDKIPKEIEVAHYGWNEGVPPGKSTIYLVLYNGANPEFGWKLVEPVDVAVP